MLAVRLVAATEACSTVTKASSTATKTTSAVTKTTSTATKTTSTATKARPIGTEGVVRVGGSATVPAPIGTITYLLDALLDDLLGALDIFAVLEGGCGYTDEKIMPTKL